MLESNFVTPPGVCARRAVLRAAGLVSLAGGGAAVLASCSPQSEPIAPAASPATSGASPTPSGSPSPSAAESEPASPSAAASSEALAGISVLKAEVPVGGGVVVDDKYVVTQPADGEFKAFSAICTHQGCPVGSVEDGEIVCPCHQSHFAIEDATPVSGPAQRPLEAVEFTESGDQIVLPG